MLKDLVFFTLNDFSKDDGGTVRMYGILNTLAKNGKNVILISNADNYSNFNKNIKHVNLDKKVTKFEKKYLQFLLGILPFFLVRIFTAFTINNIKNKVLYYNLVDRDIVFFEYLDNSIGYMLKKMTIINNYINDIHGVASIEFQYKRNESIIGSFINKFKYLVSKRLDSKVFKNAKGFIFVSDSMREYFNQVYPCITQKEFYIVRDGINKLMVEQEVDKNLLSNLKKDFKIQDTTKVIFFAGDFKDLGGVVDLLKAFEILCSRDSQSDYKLILIGDGEKYIYLNEYIKKNNMYAKVILVGRIPYTKLRTYQELADVIVCPDRKHPYSNMVPHIKYFDALVSGKIVINGSFSSVKEINKDQSLSVNFEPSDINDLSIKIEFCLKEKNLLVSKYKNNREIVLKTFTYDKFVENGLL